MGWKSVLMQGADAGLYANDDIHAIRILVLEPTSETHAKGGRAFYNHAKERLRILGEIPVRKFNGETQPTDPDGNPDTSFLAKIPADVAWTFQTLDKRGMVLNMAQTWHQLRPGEVRTNCGGCHAHSQKPTDFTLTAAAKADYPVFDLTKQTPLFTTKAPDESHKKWDAKDETGLRYEKTAKNVEFFRDVKPLFERSCVACHTQKSDEPAGNLVLDDESIVKTQNPSGLGFEISVPAVCSSGSRRPGALRLQAAEPQRLDRAGRFALYPHDAIATQFADLESLRPTARWLGKRRSGLRNQTGRSQLAAMQGTAGRRHAAQPRGVNLPSRVARCRRWLRLRAARSSHSRTRTA